MTIRNRGRRPLGRARRLGARGQDDARSRSKGVGGESSEGFGRIGPPPVDHEILSFDPAQITELLRERRILRLGHRR